MSTPAPIPACDPTPRRPFTPKPGRTPSTPLGWWALGLAGLFVVLNVLNAAVLMPLPERSGVVRLGLILYGWLMLAAGLGAGVLAVLAVWRRRERSWLVWLALLPGLCVALLLLGEFVFPH